MQFLQYFWILEKTDSSCSMLSLSLCSVFNPRMLIKEIISADPDNPLLFLYDWQVVNCGDLNQSSMISTDMDLLYEMGKHRNTSSYKIILIDHKSIQNLLKPFSMPNKHSIGEYGKVEPRLTLQSCIRSLDRTDSPKSMIFILYPSSVCDNKIFYGLRSLWTIPDSCKVLTPAIIFIQSYIVICIPMIFDLLSLEIKSRNDFLAQLIYI